LEQRYIKVTIMIIIISEEEGVLFSSMLLVQTVTRNCVMQNLPGTKPCCASQNSSWDVM